MIGFVRAAKPIGNCPNCGGVRYENLVHHCSTGSGSQNENLASDASVRRYVTCPKCSHRNDRTGGRRKCEACREALPKRRVPTHAKVLRDLSYDVWAELSVEIHGGDLEHCGVCGRGPSENRKPDRDHDHRTGLPRGLACSRCNRELLRNSTLEEARAVVAYLERANGYYLKGMDAA